MRTHRATALLLAPFLCATAHAQEPIATADSADDAAILAAASEVMTAAQFCALVTIGDDGQPQARVIDAFAPDGDLTVWIATNPVTRKVAQIRKDPRVTLFYFDAAAFAYVTLIGTAELVDDPGEKAKRWKEAWAPLYADGNRGDDYILIRVRPRRVEVVSPAHGIMNDPATWRPPSVELP